MIYLGIVLLALLKAKFLYSLIKVKFTNTAHKSQKTSQKIEDKNLKETQNKKTEVTDRIQKLAKMKPFSSVINKLHYKLVRPSEKQ
jgi:hypothetical protein